MDKSNWNKLRSSLKGELDLREISKIAYATDASVYRMKPLGVAYPKCEADIQQIVLFAKSNGISIVPRTAGTSLAGQAIGGGLVVDVSRFMTDILHMNIEEKWVDVQPGVIRDVLNTQLAQNNLFFGPNTSTSSRCMLGGMVGNNSSGTTSIKYGTTRDKVIELDVVLSDGSIATFGNGEISGEADSDLAFQIQIKLQQLLADNSAQDEIRRSFPKSTIGRRNTGYAVDVLIDQKPFNPQGPAFNLSKLIAGSEGTLCFITRIRVKLDDSPPKKEAVICAHFPTVQDSLKATVTIMDLNPFACELMDKKILDLTKGNPAQLDNRFFVEGDPGAILAIEVRGHSETELDESINAFQQVLKSQTAAYAAPVIFAPETAKVWALRAAGLGVLSNQPGDAKPVAFVEDTAVDVSDLPEYIEAFESLMKSFNQEAVYYAHAGAGELHIRPILNLKSSSGQIDFKAIAEASANLVKKFNGSLSGEHGDGRVRAALIPTFLGEKNYQLLRKVKAIWDPENIFNPGKIVDADPLDSDFRYKAEQPDFTWPTFINFGNENMLQSAERCNGSGDCRKPAELGSAMCPSYQASKNELDSTRARANVLREVMTNSVNPAYPLDSEEAKEVLDLCLSCKTCTRECPSSVDMALLKAETMYQYQRRHGIPRSSAFFGKFEQNASRIWPLRKLVNGAMRIPVFEKVFKDRFSIAQERSIPNFSSRKGSSVAEKYSNKKEGIDLVLYIDEFVQYQDAKIAEAAAQFFRKIGQNFKVIYGPSGRAAISKALLREARAEAEKTLELFEPYLVNEILIVGLEPSAVLGFRDDIPKIVSPNKRDIAELVAKNVRSFEEFVSELIERGKLIQDQFTDVPKEIAIHLHCHQKSLSHVKHSKRILNFPKNYVAVNIPSGCCGMAGSFGFEKKHYPMSQSIGELVLYPFIRMHPDKTIVAAGTSCRHQIKDGVSVKAIHPAQLLLEALK